MHTPKWSLTPSSRSCKPSWPPITRTSRGYRVPAVAAAAASGGRQRLRGGACAACPQPSRKGEQGGKEEGQGGPNLMQIKLVCLNLNRRDTWQQPGPAYRPASRANQKAEPKGYISICTPFNNVCTFHEMYVALCTQNISCTYLDIQVCKQEIGNRHVCTCMYMYVHV